ncbi:MAG: L-seryl-tRNA(Ser) seleniumtransferase [Acidobacteriota bacterium]|jgi:L-seryl-tRNA(Ser) seleniumtransferase|nr:L-seryl-tRNA(Ser) seleniumtransferase [Acidobacteriota bacterium]
MEDTTTRDARRAIPAVDRLLADPDVTKLLSLYGRDQVRVQARRELDGMRAWLATDPPAGEVDAALAALPQRIGEGLAAALGPPLQRVLNATGIFLHTNLGRAPLPRSVADALPELLTAYCDLEIDLGTGRRGQRNGRVERLLTAATGAEAAVVVNNNAAALVLALAALAPGREVVVSRGELVEIGGSFRIPEILAAAGARLVEVGATNRTRLGDYRAALRPETALLLKVFPSNFRLIGFVAAVSPEELCGLGREAGVPVLVDEGSGLLTSHPAPQLADHPSLSRLIAAGCDLVCGSGDKLLGGPQAGILAGRRDLLERCRKHPLYRALRPDRAGLATLEAVLRLHLAGAPLPLDRLWADPAEQRRRLERVAAEIGTEIGAPIGAEIAPAEAFLGGGSAPEAPIPGEALALPGDPELLARLRRGEPPVVGYLREGRLLLDLRTVDPEDDVALVAAIVAALRPTPAPG